MIPGYRNGRPWANVGGVALRGDLEASNAEWRTSWDVNVMSRVYAARHRKTADYDRWIGGMSRLMQRDC